MGEYIKREAAQAEIRKGTVVTDDAFGRGVMSGMGTALLRIEAIPTVDAVEVTRCKDCKHLMFSDCYGECGAGHYGIVRPDDFCSYGERKEDG